MPFQDDTRKYYLKKWAKQTGLKYLSNNKYYQRTVGDYNAIKHQLTHPWDKSGWYDLYNRSKASRGFQRGIFGKWVYPKSNPEAKTSTLPSPPPTKPSSRKRRAIDKLESGNNKMAKYTKRSTRRSKRSKGKRKAIRKVKKSRKEPKYIEAAGQLCKATVQYKQPKTKLNIVKATRELTSIIRRGSFWASAAPGRQSVINIMGTQDEAMSHNDLMQLYSTGSAMHNVITDSTIKQDPRVSGVENAKYQTGKKLFIQSCKCTYDITNQGPTSMYFKLYFVLPKNTETQNIDPINTWAQGYENEQGAASDTEVRQVDYINSKPTDVKLFNQNFTIAKCVYGKMDPGDEKKIFFNYHPNRFLDTGYVRDHSHIKGISPMKAMLVTWGVTADLVNQPSSTLGSITTTRTKLVGIVSQVYKGYTVSVRGKFSAEFGTVYSSPVLDSTSASGSISANPVLSIADAAGNVVDSNVGKNFA